MDDDYSFNGSELTEPDSLNLLASFSPSFYDKR